MKISNRKYAGVSLVAASFALSACGGGGGGGGGGSSAPSTTPAPPAASTTPGATSGVTSTDPARPTYTDFDTVEYRRSDGPAFHDAITAYKAGATGYGVLAGIVDTGIDSTSHEFTGRIVSQSIDATGAGRTIDDEDGHGTFVARILAAAKDDQDIHGIAIDANLYVARAETDGSCTTDCKFSESAIATGVRGAADAGAKVINLSLGGGSIGSNSLRTAIEYAVSKGAVIVVAAGNDGASANGGNPDPFAQSVLALGGGNVIIAGSVDSSGLRSSFSNAAGTSQNSYLMALGEDLCCSYKDDSIERFSSGGRNYVYVSSGTSFAAPQISGAVALLADYFPTLTGAQIVDILLRTASDAGASGTDNSYGRGILDIGSAINTPLGTTSLAGSTTAVALDSSLGTLSAPMGDAKTAASSLGTVIQDSYGRAFTADLSPQLDIAAQQSRLANALDNQGEQRSMAVGKHSLAVSIRAPQFANSPLPNEPAGMEIGLIDYGAPEYAGSRLIAGQVALSLDKETQLRLGISSSAVDQLVRYGKVEQGSFLVSDSATGSPLAVNRADSSVTLHRQFGDIGVALMAEQGKVRENGFDERDTALTDRTEDKYRHAALMVEGTPFSGLDTAIAVGMVDEDTTLLSARFDPSLGRTGARSYYADASLDWAFADHWSLGADMRQMWTGSDDLGSFTGSGRLHSDAYALTLVRDGAFLSNDRLAFRVSQPLRVSGGGLGIVLPSAYDYTTGLATMSERSLSLTPSGREISREISWQTNLQNDGWLALNAYWRTQPGHRSDLNDDRGLAIRYNMQF